MSGFPFGLRLVLLEWSVLGVFFGFVVGKHETQKQTNIVVA